MTDETQDLEPIDLSSPPSGPGWPAGWYADPWTAGQYRYWTGQSWTGETNRWGPTSAVPAGAATDAWPSAPVSAAPMASGYGGRPTGEDEAASGYVPPRRRGPIIAAAIGVALLLLVSGVVGYAINSNAQSNNDASAPPATSPPISVPSGGALTLPTTPATGPASTDPDRAVLGGLVVRQADVGPTRTVLLIPNGNSTSQPTLDLCNGTFPSEQLRTGRLQVAVVNNNNAGTTLLSTEAVLYRNPAATAQGFSELRKVRAACPSTPVVSPVGEGTAKTTFKAAPDATWPQTPTVDRQAFSFVTTTTTPPPPATTSSIAVYLRRGRVLMGLYFVQPNEPPTAVAGQKTIEGVVGVFARRLAQLPASVVNGP